MNGIRWFDEIGIGDVRSVGGKNASLGEMVKAITACGVRVPGGFAITAEAFCDYLAYNQLRAPIPDSFTRPSRCWHTRKPPWHPTRRFAARWAGWRSGKLRNDPLAAGG